MAELNNPAARAELRRIRDNDDGAYLAQGLYVFRLVTTAQGGTRGGITLPLALNPSTEVLTEPFSVAARPTVDGGLFVEENGVIARSWKISGTFGLAPKDQDLSASGFLPFDISDSLRNNRALGDSVNVNGVYSGLKHFQIFREMFREYGNLKRSPAYAPGTTMFLYTSKERESWRVIPQSFTMTRPARTLYAYTIECLLVDQANFTAGSRISDLAAISPRPETVISQFQDAVDNARQGFGAVVTKINDVRNTIRRAILAVDQAITSVTSLVNELDTLARGFQAIIGDFFAIGDAVLDLANGVKSILSIPQFFVDDVSTRIASFRARYEATFGGGTVVSRELRKAEDALDSLRLRPELFEPTPIQRFQNLLAQSNRGLGSEPDAVNVRQAIQSPQSSLAAVEGQGTGPTGFDAAVFRRGSQRASLAGIPVPRSLEVTRVIPGDTLQTIAAAQLGDASRWRELAILNGLSAPFISEAGLPGTLRPGDEILIPSNLASPEVRGTQATLGVPPSRPLREQLYGADFGVRDAGNSGLAKFDLVLDPTGTDFAVVSGVNCVVQGIQTRLATTVGSIPFYPNVGIQAEIGRPNREGVRTLLEADIASQIISDPRVSRARNVVLDTSGADIVGATVDVSLVSYRENVTIQTRV